MVPSEHPILGHVKTYLRQLRLARGMTLSEVVRETGVSRGDLSEFERGHWLAYEHQREALERVYGPLEGWYPPSVLRVLQLDRRCSECGGPLPPEARANRRKHPKGACKK